MINEIEKKDCTGCKMCADICPVQAIEYTVDNEGFWYPTVDYDKCIRCGLCTDRCPSLNQNKVKQQKNPVVYRAWSNNKQTRISSTSGGIFYEIGLWFIENGGGIAACRYTEDFKAAEHVYIDDINGLNQVKGSKYFQSDTAGIYKKVKEKLDNGIRVLFCGAPCQMAAMQMYLNKEYDNLYYMDFICRSINSPRAFKEYLNELESEHSSKVVEVQLKNKKYGWQSLATRVKFQNGEEIIQVRNSNWWVKGFIENDLYTRESCYHCKYKVLPRVVADLSIGDFWGVKNQSKKDMFNGISVMLVNSKKGKEILDNIKSKLDIKKSCIEAVLPGNPALLKSPVRTSKQDKFFKLLNRYSFSKSVEKCIHPSVKRKIISAIKKPLKIVNQLIVNPRGIAWGKYFYWNYISKSIVREGSSKIIPYKNAILQIDKTARVYLKGRNLEIGINKLRKSKAETHIRIQKNAKWYCNNGCGLFYNTVFELKSNAVFESGYFTANGGSVIVIQKKAKFGDDVMLGRNVIIYDSDFHQIVNRRDQITNYPQEIILEDHVWLTSNITVSKGVTIKKDSIITPQIVVRKDVPEGSILNGEVTGKVVINGANWSRDGFSENEN